MPSNQGSPSSSKTKQFTIIDYRRQTQNENLDLNSTNSSNKFTFKTKSFEDKQSWQSSILSCIYHDFDNNSSSNKKSPSLDYNNLIDKNTATSTSLSSNDNNQSQNNNSTLRKRLANFKRLTDFRHSLKSEFIKTINQTKSTNINQNSFAQTFNNTPKTPKNHKNLLLNNLLITNTEPKNIHDPNCNVRRLSMPTNKLTTQNKKLPRTEDDSNLAKLYNSNGNHTKPIIKKKTLIKNLLNNLSSSTSSRNSIPLEETNENQSDNGSNEIETCRRHREDISHYLDKSFDDIISSLDEEFSIINSNLNLITKNNTINKTPNKIINSTNNSNNLLDWEEGYYSTSTITSSNNLNKNYNTNFPHNNSNSKTLSITSSSNYTIANKTPELSFCNEREKRKSEYSKYLKKIINLEDEEYDNNDESNNKYSNSIHDFYDDDFEDDNINDYEDNNINDTSLSDVGCEEKNVRSSTASSTTSSKISSSSSASSSSSTVSPYYHKNPKTTNVFFNSLPRIKNLNLSLSKQNNENNNNFFSSSINLKQKQQQRFNKLQDINNMTSRSLKDKAMKNSSLSGIRSGSNSTYSSTKNLFKKLFGNNNDSQNSTFNNYNNTAYKYDSKKTKF